MIGSLANIRDNDVLSARNSSKGPLLNEVYSILREYEIGYDIHDFRDKVVHGQILPHSSYHTRRTIWNHVFRRYFKHGNDWIVERIKESTNEGKNSREFLSLAYLYYVLRDRFTFLFVTERLWPIWKNKTIAISVNDVQDFLDDVSDDFIEITHWRESTRRKLAQNTIRSLTAFGVLKGVKNKVIQQPSISDEAVFHLLCILWDEGYRGKPLIEAPDWHMFLFSEDNVSYTLNRLSMLGWIGFEKSGSTVMIDMMRKHEV